MYLNSIDLNYDELSDLLISLNENNFRFMIQTTLKEFLFDYFNIDKIKADDLDTLNLFSHDGELKLRNLSKNLYRVVYTGEKEFRENWQNDAYSFEFLNNKLFETILWGESKENQDFFVEQSIPHYFKYPLEKLNNKDTQRAVLIQKAYYDSYGNISFIRNYDLKIKTEENLCL